MDLYSRHIHLFTEEQFARIQAARILVAGAGGLGSTVLQLLARYGFHEIHIYDDGILDPPDLNRQLLYNSQDLDTPKAKTAQKVLERINPKISIKAHSEKLTASTQLPDVDLVIDCLDNFTGRLLLDQRFFNQGIPIIHGGVTRFCGQVTTLVPGKTRSLVEIFGQANMQDDSNSPKDIYPPLVTTIASIQASEAIKLTCNQFDQLLLNKIQVVDLFTNAFDIITLH